MLQLFLTLLVIAAVFAVVVVFGGRFVIGRVGNAMDRHFQQLDFILSTGLPPAAWTKQGQRVVSVLEGVGFSGALAQRAKNYFKRRLEDRLLNTIRQIERSNIITDEAVRKDMASRLRAAGRSWEELDWDYLAEEG